VIFEAAAVAGLVGGLFTKNYALAIQSVLFLLVLMDYNINHSNCKEVRS